MSKNNRGIEEKYSVPCFFVTKLYFCLTTLNSTKNLVRRFLNKNNKEIEMGLFGDLLKDAFKGIADYTRDAMEKRNQYMSLFI